MAKIDTSGWKPFVVGELFPSMVKPPVLHARQVVETDEGIPYVVRTKFNNGIKCRVHPVSDVTPSNFETVPLRRHIEAVHGSYYALNPLKNQDFLSI